MGKNQQPGWPQQLSNQPPQFPPYTEQPSQQYGQPPYAQQPGHGGQLPFGEPAPVWGRVASGVGGLAIIAVAGVVVSNGLARGGKDLVAASDATAGKSAAPAETATATPTAEPAAAVYLVDETDFTSAPVWSVKAPEGWTMASVRRAP